MRFEWTLVKALILKEKGRLRDSRFGERERLIRRSLECWSFCLDAMQTSAKGGLTLEAHENCTSLLCRVEPARNLEKCLGDYLNELSQEIFKENLRGDFSWWLPTFCSLCIQAHVGRALKVFVGNEAEAVSQYHGPAVRLFIAISPKDTDEELLPMLNQLSRKLQFDHPLDFLRYRFKIEDKRSRYLKPPLPSWDDGKCYPEQRSVEGQDFQRRREHAVPEEEAEYLEEPPEREYERASFTSIYGKLARARASSRSVPSRFPMVVAGMK